MNLRPKDARQACALTQARARHVSSIRPEQIAGKDLGGHIGQFGRGAIGHDHIGPGFEGRRIRGDRAAKERRRVQFRLIDYHLDRAGLDPLNDPLNRAFAEIVRSGLHQKPVNPDTGRLQCQYLFGNEILARAVGRHNRLDQVLRHIRIIGQKLL